MNFAELETRTRILFEAQSSTRFSSARFMDGANEALDELSESTGFYERFATIPLKGGQVYYDLRGFWPEDAFQVTFVHYPDQDIWLEPKKIRDMRDRWETVTGVPRKYLVRGIYWLGLYPHPVNSSGAVRVYYNGLAPHVTEDVSVIPRDLPDDYVPAIEDYMQYYLSQLDGEPGKALDHWGRFTGRETSLKEFVKERVARARTGRLGRRP